ncbi:MAG: threonine synthase, partial [Oscillospiraceae bacterium]
MQYISTRDAGLSVSASQAIASGISAEGGLFVPASIPTVSKAWIEQLATLEYPDRAVKVLELFLT